MEVNKKRIIIETPLDLAKLPLSVISKTPISCFTGKYYDTLFQEALKKEKAIQAQVPLEKPLKLIELEITKSLKVSYFYQVWSNYDSCRFYRRNRKLESYKWVNYV